MRDCLDSNVRKSIEQRSGEAKLFEEIDSCAANEQSESSLGAAQSSAEYFGTESNVGNPRRVTLLLLCWPHRSLDAAEAHSKLFGGLPEA